jgi:hypothetical protein
VRTRRCRRAERVRDRGDVERHHLDGVVGNVALRFARAAVVEHDGTIVPVRAGASTRLAEGIDFDEGQQRMVLPFVT